MRYIINQIRDYAYLMDFQPENPNFDQSKKNLFKFSIAFLQFILFFIFTLMAFSPVLSILKAYKYFIITFFIFIFIFIGRRLVDFVINTTESPVGKSFSKKEIRVKAIFYYGFTIAFFLFTILSTFLFSYLKHGHL